jgi:hypothetical protein
MYLYFRVAVVPSFANRVRTGLLLTSGFERAQSIDNNVVDEVSYESVLAYEAWP